MLNDPDDDIRRQALDTLNEITTDTRLTPTQAAHVITDIKTTKN